MNKYELRATAGFIMANVYVISLIIFAKSFSQLFALSFVTILCGAYADYNRNKSDKLDE